MSLSKYKDFAGGDPFPATNANSINPDNVGLSHGKLVGGTGHSALAVFQSLASGANNGKFSANIDGVARNDIAVNLLSGEVTIDEFLASTINTSIWTAVSAVVSAGKAMIGGGSNGTHSLTMVSTFANNVYRKFTFKGVVFPKTALGTHTFGFTNFHFWNVWNGNSNYNFSDNGTTGDTGVSLAGTHDLAFEFLGNGKCNFYIDGNLVRTGTGINAGTQTFVAGVYDAGMYCYIDGVYKASTESLEYIANAIQNGIRVATSALETVGYSVDHFVITSATTGSTSKILKLTSPSTGADLSGAGATPYLDCAANATEVTGNNSDAYNLVRLNNEEIIAVPAKIKEQTGAAYSLILSDAFKVLRFTNETAIAVTIPINNSITFPIGTMIDLIQGGAGKVTLVAADGTVIISSVSNYKSISAQHAWARLVKTGENAWLLYGSLIA